MKQKSWRGTPPEVQIEDNEWVEVEWSGQLESCCGCGLIHSVDHRVVKGGKLQFRARQVERKSPRRK